MSNVPRLLGQGCKWLPPDGLQPNRRTCHGELCGGRLAMHNRSQTMFGERTHRARSTAGTDWRFTTVVARVIKHPLPINFVDMSPSGLWSLRYQVARSESETF